MTTAWDAYKPPETADSELHEYADAVASGALAEAPCPWPRLGSMSKALVPGKVAIVCGDPGASKSFLMLQLLTHLVEHGTPVSMFCLEDDRRTHANRLLAQLSSESKLTDMEWIKSNRGTYQSHLDRHREKIARLGERIHTEDGDVGYAKILEWSKRQIESGARVVILDPVTVAAPDTNVWSEDKRFVLAIKQMAANSNCTIVAVTHPKAGTKKEYTMDNLAGGKAWSRFSHCVWWVVRPKEPKRVMVRGKYGEEAFDANRFVHICKTRNGIGAGCEIAMRFEPDSLLFTEGGVYIGDTIEY